MHFMIQILNHTILMSDILYYVFVVLCNEDNYCCRVSIMFCTITIIIVKFSIPSNYYYYKRISYTRVYTRCLRLTNVEYDNFCV